MVCSLGIDSKTAYQKLSVNVAQANSTNSDPCSQIKVSWSDLENQGKQARFCIPVDPEDNIRVQKVEFIIWRDEIDPTKVKIFLLGDI